LGIDVEGIEWDLVLEITVLTGSLIKAFYLNPIEKLAYICIRK
jgi:hypothetical protein